jgi:hypothetical protein
MKLREKGWSYAANMDYLKTKKLDTEEDELESENESPGFVIDYSKA